MSSTSKQNKVLNKRAHPTLPDNAVYVGRPSIWGNPFVIGRDGTREEVVEKYKVYLLSNNRLIRHLRDLKGKDLVCWCAPLACHADVLLKYANDGWV